MVTHGGDYSFEELFVSLTASAHCRSIFRQAVSRCSLCLIGATVSAEEIAAIHYFGFSWWLFYLGFQQENYDDWSSIFFNDRFVKARVELMKRWLEGPLYIRGTSA